MAVRLLLSSCGEVVRGVMVLTVGKPRVCWRLQGSRASVQCRGEIPEGYAAICSCTAQDQPPGSQERAARSAKRTETGALPRAIAHCLSPTLVRSLVCERMDFEDTPLMVESLSKEMQNSRRVLQEKKPGARRRDGASEPMLQSPHPLSPAALCAHLTAPSLQAAATRGPGPRPGLSESSSQMARDMYLQGEGARLSGGARMHTREDWSVPVTVPRHTHGREATVPGLRVHLDHPVPVALPVPVLI